MSGRIAARAAALAARGVGVAHAARGSAPAAGAPALSRVGRPTAVHGGGSLEARRSFAASNEDVQAQIMNTIKANPKDFSMFNDQGELELPSFIKLINVVVPSMGTQEIKALFTSMDTSNDGSIQASEIFSELTLSILRNRMLNTAVQHPLEGSYHCLPSPPFHSDPKQLEAINILKKVFDEVIVAHDKPIPVPVVPSRPKEPNSGGVGIFASMFGGVKKTKSAKGTTPARPKEMPPPKPNAPKGAYIYGGCGCGKTVLLDLFFRSLPDGFTARRLHWHEFIRDAFRSMQGQPPGENIFAAMADMLSKQFRVLLLDELLITHISEAILVKNLFRHMWARGMTIITTSNYMPNELYARGFNRDQFVEFIPEIESQMPVINMLGEVDYRKTDSHLDEQIFFTPISEETTNSMKQVFMNVVNNEVKEGVKVPIPDEGRDVKIPVCGIDGRGANVARFSFNDLCGQNLGRADYSVIAEKYHTIFVSDVPKFKPDLGAEFRRFVSLTDILYGKKVSLYMQSEVPTAELFTDSVMTAELDMDEMWAFRRCSSMLSEMQNPKYHHMVWLMRNHMLQESALHL